MEDTYRQVISWTRAYALWRSPTPLAATSSLLCRVCPSPKATPSSWSTPSPAGSRWRAEAHIPASAGHQSNVETSPSCLWATRAMRPSARVETKEGRSSGKHLEMRVHGNIGQDQHQCEGAFQELLNLDKKRDMSLNMRSSIAETCRQAEGQVQCDVEGWMHPSLNM